MRRGKHWLNRERLTVYPRIMLAMHPRVVQSLCTEWSDLRDAGLSNGSSFKP